MAEFTKKLSEPGLSPDAVKKIRDQFHDIQTYMGDFDIDTVADVAKRIQNYTESRETKTPEVNMLFFSSLVYQIYNKLGCRITFERGGVVKVSGGKNPEDASMLKDALNGKPEIIEWMKSGLVTNTSQWMNYIQSYPAQSSATVDNYISTREKQFTASAQDQDFLKSAKSG